MISSFFISQVLARSIKRCDICQGTWICSDADASCCEGVYIDNCTIFRDYPISRLMLVLQGATLFGVIATLVLTYRISEILAKGQIGSAESSKTSVEKKSD
jgi:hypothetical protein